MVFAHNIDHKHSAQNGTELLTTPFGFTNLLEGWTKRGILTDFGGVFNNSGPGGFP